MDLTIEPHGEVTVIKAEGDINATSCSQLEEALTTLIDQGRLRLVLDLAGVRYVSSAGLRVLLIVAKRLTGKGGFALSRAGEPVRQVLDMTGFSGIIKVIPGLDEAVALVG
jgi:anti-anti-sigma factor